MTSLLALSAALEELDFPLVLFSGSAAVERAEIAAPPGSWINLAGVDPVLP